MVHLRRLGPLARPIPVSGRPGVTGIKRIQRRLLDWEIEPIIGWVDELRRATQEAVEASVALAAARDGGEVAVDDSDDQVDASTRRSRPAKAKAKAKATATKPKAKGAARRPSAPRSGTEAGPRGRAGPSPSRPRRLTGASNADGG